MGLQEGDVKRWIDKLSRDIIAYLDLSKGDVLGICYPCFKGKLLPERCYPFGLLPLSAEPKHHSNLINRDRHGKGENRIESHGETGPFPGSGLSGDTDHGYKTGGIKHDKGENRQGHNRVPVWIRG
jgi:hypothetical protein